MELVDGAEYRSGGKASRAVAAKQVWHWLSDLDSNQDKGLQRALCYRYTIGQTDWEASLAFNLATAKQNLVHE